MLGRRIEQRMVLPALAAAKRIRSDLMRRPLKSFELIRKCQGLPRANRLSRSEFRKELGVLSIDGEDDGRSQFVHLAQPQRLPRSARRRWPRARSMGGSLHD